MGVILAFPGDDFRPPPRVLTPELMRERTRQSAAHAAAVIAGIARRRDLRGERVESGAVEADRAGNGQETSLARHSTQLREPPTLIEISTDVQGSPSQTVNYPLLSAIRREHMQEAAILPAEVVVSVAEIRETERAVAESLYPKG